MRHRLVAPLVGMTCLAALPAPAFAWGDDGHKIVGLIAEHFLDPAVLTQVNTILAGDSTGLVSPIDIPDEATWADKYRDSDRSTTKVRYDQTHNWHFVDIELSNPDLNAACFQHPGVPTGSPASVAAANDCVVDKIDEFSAELANPSTSADERRLALQLLLHFVGDLHQPLHSSDDHDQGGNSKKVHGKGTSANLHSSWDTPFVTALGGNDSAIADALIAQITNAQQTQWRQGTTANWAQESFQLAKTDAYGKLPTPNSDGSYTLDSSYVDNAHQIVKQQLSKAGVRLAFLLNRALVSKPHLLTLARGTQLLGTPDFKNDTASPGPWVATAGVINCDASEPPHGGQWVAWFDGYGQTTTM